MKRFRDKIVLVTGAGSGVGKAAALAFAAEGGKIAVVDIDEAAAKQVAKEIGDNAIALNADVTSADAVDSMIDTCVSHFGRIDVAFNNAGTGGKLAPIWDTTLTEWRRVIAVNLESVFLCMRAEARAMMRSGGGTIVNMSSVSGLIAAPGMSEYAASKHGVVGLTKAASLDLIAHGIRVNAVCPGVIDTPMLAGAVKNPQIIEQLKAAIPINRIAKPDEIARAVLFLSSDDSSYLVGHAMPIDGGASVS